MSKNPAITRFWPFSVPLALTVMAALAELGGDPLRLALRYEREGLASGEAWRLVTGHLVHLGPSHLAMNAAALIVLALMFARLLGPLDWAMTSLASALAVAGGLYWASPSVAWYVGLSGVLHGCWAAACVHAFRRRLRAAWALSILIALKLVYEAIGGPTPLTSQGLEGPVIAEAHLYGAVGGALAGSLTPAIRRLARSL